MNNPSPHNRPQNRQIRQTGQGSPSAREAKTYVFEQPQAKPKPRQNAPAQPTRRVPGRQVIREEGMTTRHIPAVNGRYSGPEGKRPQARRSTSVQRYRGDEARKISAAAQKKKEQQALLRKEARERAEMAEQERNINTLNAQKKTNRITWKTVLLLAFCTMMFMMIINNMVRIKEYEAEIRAMERQVSTLSTKRKELSDRLEQKNDLNLIEEYAVNRLGMIKADQLARRYVSLEGEDKIELVNEESEGAVSRYFTDLGAIFDSLGEKFAAFWEYIE